MPLGFELLNFTVCELISAISVDGAGGGGLLGARSSLLNCLLAPISIGCLRNVGIVCRRAFPEAGKFFAATSAAGRRCSAGASGARVTPVRDRGRPNDAAMLQAGGPGAPPAVECKNDRACARALFGSAPGSSGGVTGGAIGGSAGFVDGGTCTCLASANSAFSWLIACLLACICDCIKVILASMRSNAAAASASSSASSP
mmetsp:Transcript_13720/g.30773  ORF Transcript_13720/g.30773 Transcript_13720/m.30773 type:complete len:201 (+) Transcript_13720:532-1134(+)